MTESKVQDGGWGWFVVLGGSVSQFIFGIIGRSVGVYYLIFIERFGASATATAWITAVFMGLVNGFGPLTTALCNRFSARVVTFVGGVLMAIALIITGLWDSIIVTYVSFGVILGAGVSFGYTPCYIIVADYFDKRKGAAMGIATIGSSLGGFVGPPFVQFLFGFYGYFGAFLIIGGISLHACVSAMLYRSPARHQQLMEIILQPNATPTGQHSRDLADQQNIEKLDSDVQTPMLAKECKIQTQDDNKATKDVDDTLDELDTNLSLSKDNSRVLSDKPILISQEVTTKKKKILDFSLLKNVNFLLLSVSYSQLSMCFASVITFLPAMAVDHGFGTYEATSFLSIISIADAIWRIPMGFIFDIKRLREYRVFLYIGCQFIMAATVILMPLITDYWGLAIVCSIRGSFSAVLMPQRMTIMGDMFGTDRASSALGLQLFIFAIGSVVARTLGGLCKDYLGNYDAVFYLSGSLLVIISIILFSVLWAQRAKRTQTSTSQDEQPMSVKDHPS